MVHHGASRAGLNCTSAIASGVLLAGRSLEEAVVWAPQVFEAGDPGQDTTKCLWWGDSDDEGVDADGGERDWKWGGNSTEEFPASVSAFQVLTKARRARA